MSENAPQKVVTRFAPSPTGYFHAGSYRTALFAYIYARQHKGKFILRIEDTDKARSKKEYEENIVESLNWLGLVHDEFSRQSDRGEIYKKHIQALIDSGHAFISKETPKNPGDRTEVIRFKNPNKKVTFTDMIRGEITFDTTELGDFVIAKDMNEPVFHLVNVVDDFEMGVTHIIRGDDHISNTPRQILIYEALKAPVPRFAHIPLLLSADRAKLSKRKGAIPVSEYRTRGFLPEAIVNYFALLGWHPSDDRELFTMGELFDVFSLDRVQKSGAIFDEEKLKWYNHQYIMKLDEAAFMENAKAFLPEWLITKNPLFKRLIPILREKLTTFGEIHDLLGINGELRFVKDFTDAPVERLLWKKSPDKATTLRHLKHIRETIHQINPESFDVETIKKMLWDYAETNGRGDVLWPMRMAITGQDRSPDPFTSAHLIGPEETLSRLDKAISKLE